MDLTSEYFTLADELMYFLTKGEGMYAVADDDTSCKLLSVTVKLLQDENGEMIVFEGENNEIQFYMDTLFVQKDESRGSLQICLEPIMYYLYLAPKSLKLSEGESMEEKIAEFKKEITNELKMNHDSQTMWAKCLMNYIRLGNGTHKPNFVDAALGLKKVVVRWMNDDAFLTELDNDILVYRCEVAFATNDESRGSIVFKVVPFDISISS